MKKTKALASMVLVVLSAVLGCDRGDARSNAPDTAQQAGRVTSHSFAFGSGSAKASSRVERQISANGGEVLRGTTEVLLAGAAHPEVVTETAELDASGRLLRATSELRTGSHGTTVVRSVEIDAVKGAVTVRDEDGERAWLVPAEHPWMFADLTSDVAPHASGITAVQAWVARRAAQAGARIRLVEVVAHRSVLTMADQVVFEDGDRDLVVLGDEIAETDREFVRALSWKTLEALSNELRAADVSCEPGPV